MSTTTTSSSSSVEEDVMRIKKRLEKMMKAKEIDVNISIDMLNTLKKLPIDLQILTTTGIGVVLNSLRKSCDSEDLGTLAKTVLKNWRKLVASETPGNTNVSSPNSNSNDSSTKQPVSPVTTPANTSNGSNGSLKRTLSDSPTDNQAVPSKQANHHTDNNNSNSNNNSSTKSDSTVSVSTKSVVNGINRSLSSTSSTNGNIGRDAKRFNRSQSYTETKDSTRLKCREMLANALEIPEPNEFKSEMIDVVELAARCEDAIFSEFKSTDMKYKNKIRSRVLNLKDAKNPKLRENVRLGYISPEKFASMTAEEMASDELKNLRAQLTKEAINDHQMARTQGAKTSLLKCSKCKSNNIVYSEMQTRSADEPMTTFAFCQDCGHRWKFC